MNSMRAGRCSRILRLNDYGCELLSFVICYFSGIQFGPLFGYLNNRFSTLIKSPMLLIFTDLSRLMSN